MGSSGRQNGVSRGILNWSGRKKPLALIVDEEEAIREMIVVCLNASGYNVATAANGADGAQLALTTMPDVVVAGLSLPIMSGVEMLEAIRTNEQGERMPVIIIARDEGHEELARAEGMGEVRIVTMPFDINIMLGHIMSVCIGCNRA